MSTSTVMVTGASGYIAGWIVKELLEAGHTVHATVRDPNKATSVDHLKAIAEQAPGTLKLFKADLLDADSFDAPLQGCDILMHTASPFVLEGFTDAYEALVRPAVEGTRHVLEAAKRCPTLKRVVLTSSVASVYGDNAEMKGKTAFTEADWNTTSSVDHNPYQYSKVAAEREAWKIHDTQDQWDLVTINPGMVYGPSLTRASNSASIDTLLQMGRGKLKTGVPALSYGVVDVREVAHAHVLAAFSPEAEGRYILVNRELSMLGIADILRKQFGNRYPFPRMQVPKAMVWLVGPMMGPVTRKFISRNVGHPIRFDNSRSQQLGVSYRPLTETFTDHFQQVLDDGLVRPR
ncbi:NAD-dependent epimerase/dehydratase family protein [Alcanivorax hongdengensis A-11-3]|uniref:NAD-dependent epimerase/dehydratase family protein n=1 Tax=Alcanivorax hongdengensis A-11-3 TaxID=1177179 RepID=L0WBM3_9GAMM|nr:aldehyde reductase [Alcanivorax hongdengensis]EKF73140.1 NAD-dependent epimerase/dehydratase family protein [Alcanivorax hongdengensis A-11-3]